MAAAVAEVTLEADEAELIELNHLLIHSSDALVAFFDRMAEGINALITGWETTGEDQSRQAHDDAQTDLVAAGRRSAEALRTLGKAVGQYAAKVHDTEVRNVAAIG